MSTGVLLLGSLEMFQEERRMSKLSLLAKYQSIPQMMTMNGAGILLERCQPHGCLVQNERDEPTVGAMSTAWLSSGADPYAISDGR